MASKLEELRRSAHFLAVDERALESDGDIVQFSFVIPKNAGTVGLNVVVTG
jgi:hypothetical protein